MSDYNRDETTVEKLHQVYEAMETTLDNQRNEMADKEVDKLIDAMSNVDEAVRLFCEATDVQPIRRCDHGW